MRVKLRNLSNRNNVTLGFTVPASVIKTYSYKQGDEFELIDEDGILKYVPVQEWAYYTDLSKLTDKELYERYKEGKLRLTSWCSGYIKKRIDDYLKK